MVGAGSKVVGAADRGVPNWIKQPIDAGPTAQRYAERAARVKLDAPACRRCPTRHRDTSGEPSTSDTPTGLEPVDNQLIHRCEGCYVSGHRVVARVSRSWSGPHPLKRMFPDNSGQCGSRHRHWCTTCGQTCGHAVGLVDAMTRGGGTRVEQPSSATDLARLWTTIVEGTAPAQRVWLATSKLRDQR